MIKEQFKEPLLAVIYSLILPGLGQIYSRRVKRGIVLLVISIIAGLLAYFYVIHPTMKSNIYMAIAMIAVWIFGVYIIFDSYFCAKAFNNNNNQKRQISIVKRIVLNFGIVLFGYVFYLCNPIANYVRVNMVQAFRVTSGSMAPTLIKGDRILTDKSAYKSTEPQRGDIVVFYYPEDTTKIFVDRLIASGMETVEIKEGNVYIDGALVTDPRIKDVNYINRGDYGSGVFDVPKGHYFMLGDNSVSSHDSRYWGSVPKRNIQGKAFKIYYPFNRSGAVE